jgi:phage shock protein A
LLEDKVGLSNRISTLVKQKVNSLLDKYEDPKEALDYSYQKQIETLNKLRRSVAEVITAKKRLEMQKTRLLENVRTLDIQSRSAIDQDREDLAKLALERKNANIMQIQDLDKQITDMQAQQDKLEQTEKSLSTKVEEFRSKKEVIKAQYTAADAQVHIKENITGISEEMASVGMAMNRAEDKTEKMKAKAQALDEMMDSGVLTDYTSDKDDIESELEKATIKSSVDEELAKLRAERDKNRKKANKQVLENTQETDENNENESAKIKEEQEVKVTS